MTTSREQTTYMPAEWHPQWGVQLTWPHEATDWLPILGEVTECYLNISKAIAAREHLLVVTPHVSQVRALLATRLSQEEMQRVILCQMPTNDTWARDHGFITLLEEDGKARLLDFCFNGWGEKFPAQLDNLICRTLMQQGVLQGSYEDHLNFVLEGGSIELSLIHI